MLNIGDWAYVDVSLNGIDRVNGAFRFYFIFIKTLEKNKINIIEEMN